MCGTLLKLWFDQIDYTKLCHVPVQKPEIWPWTWSFFPDWASLALSLLFLKNQPRTKLAARGLLASARDCWWPAHCAVLLCSGDCAGLCGAGRHRQTEIHRRSAASRVKGHDRGLANIPAEAADIWFCTQRRHSEPNTTCHLLVSQTARPLLLGHGEGGREGAGWRVRGWLGRQVTWQAHRSCLSLSRARERWFITRPQKTDRRCLSMPAPFCPPSETPQARLESRACAGAQQGQGDRFSPCSTWRTFSGIKMFGYWGVCVLWPLFCGDGGGNYSLTRRGGRARFLQTLRYCCTVKLA